MLLLSQNRSKQAEQFAEEEAALREQFMIEQEKMLHNQERGDQRLAELAAEQERWEQQRLSLLREKNKRKPETIEQNLGKIRQQLKPRKVDNSVGIAALRAAVAA